MYALYKKIATTQNKIQNERPILHFQYTSQSILTYSNVIFGTDHKTLQMTTTHGLFMQIHGLEKSTHTHAQLHRIFCTVIVFAVICKMYLSDSMECTFQVIP